VVRGLINIGEFELFTGNQGVNAMNFGNDMQGRRGKVVGEKIRRC
jgi:hypothetical protein